MLHEGWAVDTAFRNLGKKSQRDLTVWLQRYGDHCVLIPNGVLWIPYGQCYALVSELQGNRHPVGPPTLAAIC